MKNNAVKKKRNRPGEASPDAPYKKQGDIIRNLRIEKGFTNADDAAEAIGYSASTYRAWEQGRNLPGEKAIRDLSDFFNVSEFYLRGEVDYRKLAEKDICEYTGLSPEAVRCLYEIKKGYNEEDTRDFIFPYYHFPECNWEFDHEPFHEIEFINLFIESLAENYSISEDFLLMCEQRFEQRATEISFQKEFEKDGFPDLPNPKVTYLSSLVAEGNIIYDSNMLSLTNNLQNFIKESVDSLVENRIEQFNETTLKAKERAETMEELEKVTQEEKDFLKAALKEAREARMSTDGGKALAEKMIEFTNQDNLTKDDLEAAEKILLQMIKEKKENAGK